MSRRPQSLGQFCTLALLLLSSSLAFATVAVAADRESLTQVFSEDEPLTDSRLKPLRKLRDAYHPWVPPTSLDDWKVTARDIREQVLVAAGLWPMPEKTPLNSVIHGRVDRDEYTVEKVYFSSRPGHYVTGSLYRPTKFDGPRPGVLCPHGHWADGRFYDAGDDKVAAELKSGAESFEAAAHVPIHARCVQLARMGCIVFHYDMLGYADSQPIAHRSGMDDVRSLLWQNNKLGLQTWNSIRALDFLETLEDIDSSRFAVTGASGGGTQTMLLAAVDDRVAVSFPAVMVSTGMQGGCICENAAYLRIGLNNIAFAAAFAPKPQKMSGADDWTVAIETKGLPELKQVYSLYGQANLVDARALTQFKHNYNQRSRELMYDWFNDHLRLGLEAPVKESDFEPVPVEELAVFDASHPVPEDALDDAALQKSMTDESQRQFAALVDSTSNGMEEYRSTVGAAARVMLGGRFPDAAVLESEKTGEDEIGDVRLLKGWVKCRDSGTVIPWLILLPPSPNGRMTLWIDGAGKQHLLNEDGQPTAAVAQLLEEGVSVVSVDVFGTGEFPDSAANAYETAQAEQYPGFLYGYNQPILAQRVQDILTALAALHALDEAQQIQLVGTGDAGVWTLLARALTPPGLVEQTTVDLNGHSFAHVTEPTDPLLLPAALKYGGLGGLSALAMPADITIHGVDPVAREELQPLVTIAKHLEGKVQLHTEPLSKLAR